MNQNVTHKCITNKKKTKYFTINQKKMMLDNCETGKQYIALLIGFDFAVRAGEILTLKLEDINFNTRIVHIFDSKKKIYRKIPASIESINAIKRYCKDKNIKSGYLLNIHRITLTRWVKEIANKCGIKAKESENIRYHSLRHSWIRHNSNRPLKYVCQVTGDSKETIIDVYSEYSEENLINICDGNDLTVFNNKGWLK